MGVHIGLSISKPSVSSNSSSVSSICFNAVNVGESNGLAQHSQNDSSCAWGWVHGELEERDLTQPVTSRSFRSFISLLVINGSVSFLMEGNREEMVSCLHLSGICLKGRSRSLEIGQGCVFPGMRNWLG